MPIVVDASVVMKWALIEDGSDRARSLLVGAEPLLAPDFLLLECANVLATQVRRGLIAREDARAALEAFREAPVRYLPSAPHVSEAHTLAVGLGRSAYDCLYLALAIAEGAALVTADARFAQSALAGDQAGRVRVL